MVDSRKQPMCHFVKLADTVDEAEQVAIAEPLDEWGGLQLVQFQTTCYRSGCIVVAMTHLEALNDELF